MLVEHFLGKTECNTCEELEQVLELRTEKGVNEFTLELETYYPYLIMHVNKDYAYVHYFWDDGPGSASMDESNGLDEYGYTEFYLGDECTELLRPNFQVVSFAKAKSAALEFFKTKSRPTNIEWMEL